MTIFRRIKIFLRDTAILHICIILIFLGFSVKRMVANVYERRKILDKIIAVEEERLSSNAGYSRIKSTLQDDYKTVKEFFTVYSGSDKQIFSILLKDIEKICQRSGARIANLAPELKPREKDRMWIYDAQLRLEGTLAQLETFLEMIDQDTRLVNITDFSFYAKNNSDGVILLECTCSLNVVKQ